MATKQSKGKLKNQKLANLPKEKDPLSSKIKGYKVRSPVWILGIHRHPGHILTAEDIGFLKLKKAFDLNLKRKVIEVF